jgi:predicted AAA+ superfamily ATPase
VCAARNGQILDKSAIARDVGVKSNAINDWISILQASNQIFILEPWYSNFGKRIVKSPKLYWADTGFLCFILGITEERLLESPFLGTLWETFIYSQMRKKISEFESPDTIWFYRDNQQLEIDFIVAGGGRAQFIECKWSEFPDSRDARAINALASYIAPRKISEFSRIKGYILCRTPNPFPIDSHVKAISIESLSQVIQG